MIWNRFFNILYSNTLINFPDNNTCLLGKWNNTRFSVKLAFCQDPPTQNVGSSGQLIPSNRVIRLQDVCTVRKMFTNDQSIKDALGQSSIHLHSIEIISNRHIRKRQQQIIDQVDKIRCSQQINNYIKTLVDMINLPKYILFSVKLITCM